MSKSIFDTPNQVTWNDIEKIAVPGDMLEGNLYYSEWIKDEYGEYVENRIPTQYLTFWSCITCLTGKEDVRNNSNYFLKRVDSHEGVFYIRHKIKKEETEMERTYDFGCY